MRVLLACVLALTSSALGYQVTIPNASQGWTNSGGQPFTWQRVDTDPQNFTAVLTNVNLGPANNQVLAALVDGLLGNTTLLPPSEGWPSGSGFRVNIVLNTENLNTILAQSDEFKISAVTSSTLSGAVVTSSISTATVPTVLNPTTPGASSTTATLAPVKSNGALQHVQAHVGLWGGALGLLGFFLA